MAALARAALGTLIILAMTVFVVPSAALAATLEYVNSTPLSIPDAVGGNCDANESQQTVNSTIEVTDEGTIENLQVALNIYHSFIGDLVVDLTSPQGTTIRLVNRIGIVEGVAGCGSMVQGLVATFSDDAATPIAQYSASGLMYTPQQALSAFDLQETVGTWTLSVTDASQYNGGTLQSWSLKFGSASDLAIADVTVNEHEDSAVFTVTRTGSVAGTDSVKIATVDGSAIAGQHYVATSGTLNFAMGQTTATVEVPLIDNAIFEGNRAFTLELSDPAGSPAPTLSRAIATATIVDDETRPHFSIADVVAGEGDGSVTLTVTRTGAPGGTDTVDYATADGSARGGVHYVAAADTLTFAPGDTTASLTIDLLDDDVFDGDRVFTVALANPTSTSAIAPTIDTAPASISITENDVLPDFSIANSSVADDARSVYIDGHAIWRTWGSQFR